jgi:hypothetical protein
MPPLAAVPNLERELDELYGLPLEDFTRARNDLVARLKRAHQADAAEQVRVLKKPSLVAWTANRLARDEPERVAELLRTAHSLREVQQAALSGKTSAAEVGDASAAERTALQALVGAARSLLGTRASAGMLERLGQTLRAAASDEAARPLLERGRLTQELQAAGFGGLRPVPQPRRRRDDLARAARERVQELREEARRLDREAREAEEAATEAARVAAQARAAADAVEQALAAAEADLDARR